jgi:hypothetical protein
MVFLYVRVYLVTQTRHRELERFQVCQALVFIRIDFLEKMPVNYFEILVFSQPKRLVK